MSWITSLFAGLFAGLGWIVVGAAVIAAILVHVFGKVLPSWVPAAVIAALGLAFVGNNVLKTEQLRTEQMAHLATKQQHATVLQGIAWIAYVVPCLALYLRPARVPAPERTPVSV